MVRKKQDLPALIPPGKPPYNGFNELGFPISKRNHPAYGYTAKGKPVHAYNAAGKPICGRKLSGENSVCQNTLLSNATGRCTASGHGGRESRGAPPIKHGRKSKYLEGLNLSAKFAAALTDPELISHRKNAALLEVLKNEELDGALPPAELWKRAHEIYQIAVAGDAQALQDLGPVLASGLGAAERITRAVELAEKQRKHIDSEVKRESELQTSMSAREASAFTLALAAAVMEGFEDLIARAHLGITVRDLIATRVRIAQEVSRRMS